MRKQAPTCKNKNIGPSSLLEKINLLTTAWHCIFGNFVFLKIWNSLMVQPFCVRFFMGSSRLTIVPMTLCSMHKKAPSWKNRRVVATLFLTSLKPISVVFGLLFLLQTYQCSSCSCLFVELFSACNNFNVHAIIPLAF